MNRKDFLRYSGIGAAFSLISGSSVFISSCGKNNMMMNMDSMSGGPVNIIEGTFDMPLQFPQVSGGMVNLTAQNTKHSVFKNKYSQVFGYQNNSILGPTIKVNSGTVVNAELRNNLSEPTNIHWHGLIVPAAMDGHPDDVIQQGSSFNYNFMVNQRAGMYWYHPHADGYTSKHTFKGLAGIFIVNDKEEQALNLPTGNFEIPIVIQDKRVFPDYSLDYSPQMMEIMTGYLGQYIIVNGSYAPNHEVNRSSYRVRILNGSNARIYNIALNNGDSFSVIGSDGGLLTSSQTVSSLIVGPGERADLIINFDAYTLGQDIFLISKTFSAGSAQGKQEFRIMKFSVTKNDMDTFSMPASLSTINIIPESTSTKTRTFTVSDMNMGSGMNMNGGMNSMKGFHKINDKSYQSDRIDETVKSGATEIWIFDNSAGQEPHPMHIHGIQFQVLDRIGGRNSLIVTENGWKDTVLLMPGEKVRTIMKFSENKGKFVLHCHNLEHEDSGMMLQFEVV
ncbi:MAG: multicopper oxidase domain-containing protein [Bacteroidia bacterium]|nr:multicopper oxidase domain-containing protein [Bacteroidia bacterium]